MIEFNIRHVNKADPFPAYFWHVSDFHLDTNYTTSSGDDVTLSSREYYIGDYEYDLCWAGQSGDIGRFGNYDCDAPIALISSAVEFMSGYDEVQAQFVLWTG